MSLTFASAKGEAIKIRPKMVGTKPPPVVQDETAWFLPVKFNELSSAIKYSIFPLSNSHVTTTNSNDLKINEKMAGFAVFVGGFPQVFFVKSPHQ